MIKAARNRTKANNPFKRCLGGIMVERPDSTEPLPGTDPLPDEDLPESPDVNDPVVPEDPDVIK